MIKSKNLAKIKDLKHGFFNSNGGKSKNIYRSLNCGLGSKDIYSNIRKNLDIVKKKISKSSKDIFLLNQIHSNKFIYINEKSKIKKKPYADAIITNQKNLPIAVLTADCVPILIYDNKKKIIAAIHAGWKGAYKGIVKKVVNSFKKKGSLIEDLVAVIGPSIACHSYEVQKDFKDKFLKKNKQNKVFFKNQ